jgi:hypothetical protein
MFGRPEKIKKAIVSGDTDYLSAAGRKGAEAAQEKRLKEQSVDEADKLYDEILAEQELYEDEWRRRQANEHIIDPRDT